MDLSLKNEFGELQDAFNAMAEQIEAEIHLRRQAEESRKKLILDISHDLKNPLASVIGYAETYQNSPDLTEKDRADYIKIIYENGLRANRLISDLFELSKLDSPDYVLSKQPTDICEYLRVVFGRFLPQLEAGGFGYDILIPEKEISLMLDPLQLDRVFQNLFDNALSYNPSGTRITLELRDEDRQLVILFADNGIGIPADLAFDIFKPFVRADSSRNSKTGGSGLGLAIAQKIVTAHGGTLELKSDAGQGCEFAIRLPTPK